MTHPTVYNVHIVYLSNCFVYLVLADDDSLHGLHDVDAAGPPLGPDDPVCAGEVHVPAMVQGL